MLFIDYSSDNTCLSSCYNNENELQFSSIIIYIYYYIESFYKMLFNFRIVSRFHMQTHN